MRRPIRAKRDASVLLGAQSLAPQLPCCLQTGWTFVIIAVIIMGLCVPGLQAAPPQEIPPLTDDPCESADILRKRMAEIDAEIAEKFAPLLQLLAQRESLQASLNDLRYRVDLSSYLENDIAAARDIAAEQKAELQREAQACREMASTLNIQQLALFNQQFSKYMAEQNAKGHDIDKLKQAKLERMQIINAAEAEILTSQRQLVIIDMRAPWPDDGMAPPAADLSQVRAATVHEIEALETRIAATKRVIETIDRMFDPQVQSPDDIIYRSAKLREALGQERNTWDTSLGQLRRDQDHARRVTAELFLGADPAILTSMDAEAILRELAPALKADFMTKRAEMLEQMAHDVDEGMLLYIRTLEASARLGDIPETAELADNLEQLIRETDALMTRVYSLVDEYTQLKPVLYKWAVACRRSELGSPGDRIGQILDPGGATIIRADPAAFSGGLKVGQAIVTESGAWEEGQLNQPVPGNKEYTIGPFDIPAPCKIKAHITGEPPIESALTATNWGAGMHGQIEPVLVGGGRASVGSFDVALYPGKAEVVQEITVKYPAKLMLKFTPALSTGQAGGYLYQGQSYMGVVEVVELLQEGMALPRALITSSDRMRIDGMFPATIRLSDGTTMLIYWGSEVAFSETVDGGIRATLERGGNGGMRITNPALNFEAAYEGKIIKAKGTDFFVDTYDVKVVDGEAEVIDEESGETVVVQAGQKMDFRGSKVTEFDATEAAPFTTGNGLPTTINFFDPAEEPYGVNLAQFNNDAVADGWLLADPPTRHSPRGFTLSNTPRVGVETPEPGVLRLSVPVGSVVPIYDRAPRLLHKVTGDFDLEADLHIEEANGNPVSADFVVYAPGTGIGLQKHEVQWGNPAQDYWLPPPCVVRLSADGPFLLPLFNDHHRGSRYDWPEVTDGKARSRLSRRGDTWSVAWSLDGQTWNTHTLDSIALPQTLWVGWAFQHAQQRSTEPAVFTVRDVRLETAPTGTMIVPAWRVFSINGSVQAQDAPVRLVLDGGGPGVARAISRAPLSGNFDVVVRFDAGQWQHEPGEMRRWSIAATTPDQQEAVAVGCIIRDDGQRYWAQRQQGWEGGSSLGQSSPVEHLQGKLRLVREDGVVSAYYWDADDWQRQSFSWDTKEIEGPLFLRLEAFNGRANATHPWGMMSVDFTVEQITTNEAPTAQQGETEPLPIAPIEETVLVTPEPQQAEQTEPPGILGFTATPQEVEAGQQVTLHWQTRGGQPYLYRIDGNVQTQLATGETLPLSGARVVAVDASPEDTVAFALGLLDLRANQWLATATVEVKVR